MPGSTHAPGCGIGAGTAAWSTSQSVQKWEPLNVASQTACAPLRPPRLAVLGDVKPRNWTAVPPMQQASGRAVWQPSSPFATKLVLTSPRDVTMSPRWDADPEVQPVHVLPVPGVVERGSRKNRDEASEFPASTHAVAATAGALD